MEKMNKENGLKEQTIHDYAATITILEHLTDAIFILSKMGVVEYANKAALEMVALNMYQLTGLRIDAIVSDDENSAAVLNEILQQTFNEVETEFTAKNYTVPVLLSFGVVKNSKDEVSYIIASARDIGWRKEMERVVSQKQMLAMSKSRYREMGDLTVSMVHNLSQPVTSMRLKMDLLEKELQQKRINKEKVQNHLNKMSELLTVIDENIDNARNFAFKTEDQSYKIISLKENLQHAIEQLKYEFTDKDITINSDFARADYDIMANPITIQQVIVTLLRLQMDHLNLTSSPAGKRSIDIKITDNSSKWLGMMITASCSYAQRDYIPQVKGLNFVEDFDLDLKMVEMVAESLGGDFKWYPQAQEGFIFSLRIPIDTDNERNQLRNMIELFHDA